MISRLRSTFLLTIVCLAAIAGTAMAQKLSSSMAARVDSIFAAYDTAGSPGCALGIYRNGAIVYTKGYGIANLEHNVPITSRTAFDIGSTSKQFTAASLVLLAEQGKLSLDDDVRKYIPELPDYGHTLTIRHLLTHTGGVRDHLGLIMLGGYHDDDVITTGEALRFLVRQKALDFEPGTAMRYSNGGYLLAAVIVERVSGKSLRLFAREQIFEPLGMKNTSFVDDHTAIVPNRAEGYDETREGYRRSLSYWEDNGSGGVLTTVEDLLLWDENFYRPRVGRALPATLLRRGVLTGGDTLDYSLGLIHEDLRGVPIVTHSGATAGYTAEFIRVPSEHLSVAVLCNCSSIDPVTSAHRVVETVLADRLPKSGESESIASPVTAAAEQKTVTIDPPIFDAYAGEYALAVMPSFILTFRRDGDRYYSRATDQEEIEMFPTSDSTFRLNGIEASVTFHREPDGSVKRISLEQGGKYRADRVVRAILTPDDLAQYVGEYYSPEVGNTYTVVVEEGKLVTKHRRFEPATLTLYRTDSFSGSEWYVNDVTFERGSDGRVTAMLVSFGRIKNMRFERQK